MPIYVAKNSKGQTEGVVLAESYKLAQSYWMGCGITIDDVLTLTEKDLDNHPTGIIPLLRMKKITLVNQYE